MKAHIRSEQPIMGLPTTYEGLKAAYMRLLACQDEYKRNLCLQATKKANEIVSDESQDAFCRASNIWLLAIKRDPHLTDKTAQRLLDRVIDEIIPEWEHYVKKLEDTDDGAGDDWMELQLDGYPRLQPRRNAM